MRIWDETKPIAAPTPRGQDEIKLTCKIITPVFGGGVDPKKPDEVTPVRATALRGLLRFWWRVTSSEESVAALRDAEASIFGGVHDAPQASCVSVAVTRQPRRAVASSVFKDGDSFKVADGVGHGLAYGAFPLRSLEASKVHDKLRDYTGGEFEWCLRFPSEVRRDVERALWGLLHFGGIGGRTRRGFGALELVKGEGFQLRPIADEWPNVGETRAWPVLNRWEQSARSFPDATRAHEGGLLLLQEMRQGTELGRGRGQERNRPGRSHWPEPDAIRALYKGRVKSRHLERKLLFDKYPRAAFGAPIIFHFKTERGEVEPPDVTLVPTRDGKPMSRLASPLIIRPHRDSDGQYRALAAKLVHPEGGWALLERQRLKASGLERRLEKGEAQEVAALKGVSTDPVDAYLTHLSRL